MEPMISVIVPVYKVEPYLRQCVDSIRNQTYANLEIILVDDGSPDGCPQICDEYAALDTRIKVIHKKNGGQASARNAGMQIASGDYVTFVDSDDWLDCQLYETVMNQAPFDTAVFGLTMDFVDTRNSTVVKACEKSFLLRIDQHGDEFRRLAQTSLLGYACNKVYSKAILKDKLFPELNFREDLLLNLDVLGDATEIRLVNTEGYHYIQRGTSTLHSVYSGSVPDIVSVAERLTSIHPLLPQALNHTIASYVLQTCLSDAFYKFIINNDMLSQTDAIEEIRKVFSNRTITSALKLFPLKGKLFTFLTICAKMRTAHIFYFAARRLWHG